MAKPITPRKIAPYSRMSGEVYDLIYSKKDYPAEATKLTEIIEERCESGNNELLEAACGTGTYMKLLSDDFTVEGFDKSAGQLKTAKKKLPETRIIQADMLDFDMGKQYDVVLCLFSSIGYLLTIENLQKALTNFAKHTKPGGLVIIEPWLQAEDLIPGYISLEASSGKHLSVARMGKLTRKGSTTAVDMHHMIGTNDGIEHFLEVHELALFTDKDFTQAFHAAGLEIYIDAKGLNHRLCVGKKPL